jgi:DNA-binding LacI/PurR family transcriptional regulator
MTPATINAAMSGPTRPARLLDVAREAGVHLSTVSRVLNDAHDSSTRPETRARILEAAARLEYRPNALGRGLKLARTGAIGFLVPSLRNPANSPIVLHAFDRAWQQGYVVLLAEDSERHGTLEAYERLVAQGRIDGLLVQSARTGESFFDRLEDGRIPCVFVDRAHQPGGRNVTMRDADAGTLAARHLLDLGHRQIAHLAGPSNVDTTERRRVAFLAEMHANGCFPLVVNSALSEQAGYQALESLRRDVPGLSALYVSNINQAIGLTAAARDAGLRVPDDLSVLCHDDDPIADYLAVPLSGISMPLGDLGSTAVDTLIEQIEGKPPRDVVIPHEPELVDRGSTAPLRA